MPFGTSPDHIVVSSQDLKALLPLRQSCPCDVARSIRWIENVRQENVTACGKVSVHKTDHCFETLLEICNPWQCLVPAGPIHGLLPRGSAAVIMNQVVSTGRDNNKRDYV